MLISLGLIFLLGLALAGICKKLKLPGLVGMIFTGIILGPYMFNLLDSSLLAISSDLRNLALMIILIKAGLSLDLNDLKKVGRSALMMSFVPATCEIIGVCIIAPLLLNFSFQQSLLLGSVLAAVSPAVVVPRMSKLMDLGYGKTHSIPQLIMAGASCDDIFVIVLFSSFLSMNQGGSLDVSQFINIPISIVLGIMVGIAIGYILSIFFEYKFNHQNTIRNSVKVIIILGLSCLLYGLEAILKPTIAFSGLLAVVAMAATIKVKCIPSVTVRLSQKYAKLWLAAEVLLFVLVGASVDIRYTLTTGVAALLVIVFALCFRSIGVLLCMVKTKLSLYERLFCILAYLPKATVQAAIGSLPLSYGLSCGPTILSLAVVAILFTAPVGAFLIDTFYPRLLTK